MFGFFKSSNKVNVMDKVWMTSAARLQACRAMHNANPKCLFIAWFPESATMLKQAIPEGSVVLAEDVDLQKIQDRMVVFTEHYPLQKTEEQLFLRLNLKEVPVLSALDEPLFKFFGGERMQELMKQLGMGDNEILGHSMITSAIKNAQRKLAQRVFSEQKTNSQEKWFQLNFTA
ncbi:MAG: hypothetical protein KF846_15825 [Cyclobacteriaceae bacterium]|nr:hypothetical protein [Cyclobacteriaceae bacterium]